MHALRYLSLGGTRQLIWRSITTVATDTEQTTSFKANTKMGAWCITKYGGINSLVYNQCASFPVVRNGCDVLVEIHAASVNPLDVEMTSILIHKISSTVSRPLCDRRTESFLKQKVDLAYVSVVHLVSEGYGRNVIGTMRTMKNVFGDNLNEFPLTLGRDFSGIIRDKGNDVKGWQIGDEVMGVIPVPKQGTHAHYTVASSNLIIKKPSNLSHLEAASLGYAGLTAWSALTCFGGIRPRKSRNKYQWVLIFGGSGGVGSIAIQMLKAWGTKVVCVASTSAVDLVKSLGADAVVDYKNPDWQNQLKQYQGFDLVLNSISHSASGLDIDVLKRWSNAKFVTLNTPLLRNIDAFGWPLGFLQSAAELSYDNIKRLCIGQTHRWAYVVPSNEGLQEITTLVNDGKLLPVIECVFPMNQIQLAYQKVQAGHSRGKTVINVKDSGQ